MWVMLWREGMRGKIWRVVKDMYRKTTTKIRINGNLSEEFETTKGVRQ